MKRLFGVIVLIALIATATVGFAADQSTKKDNTPPANLKLSPDLLVLKGSSAQVVVQYNQAPSLADLKLLGLLGKLLNSLPLVNGIVAQLPLSNILSLAKQDNVRYISLDRTLTPSLSNAAPAVNAFAA